MSILETQVIDMFGVDKDESGKVFLGIADHLDWEKEQEGEHLLMLQEKINTYIAFYESGQIYEALPSAQGKQPVIQIIGKYPLSPEAETFVSRATPVLRDAGIELEFVLKETSQP